MSAMDVLILIAGLALLLLGAEQLVRGASRLASRLGVSPLVVGLTVVAFGTSAPEIVVSLSSALAGQGGLALGNAVGSNIFNILMILGLSAAITPLTVAQRLVRQDAPLMALSAVALAVLAWNGSLGRLEGLLLVSALAAYLLLSIRLARREPAPVVEEYAHAFGGGGARVAFDIARTVVGLALLVWGADWTVSGATAMARAFGMSELTIGATVVAAGTSLPELVTSAVAAVRGERDIAVGNVVGSNLFNVLGVAGLAAVVAPDGIAVSSELLAFHLPVMLAASIACLPIFFTGWRIDRWEGWIFLAYYVFYTAVLVGGEAWRPTFGLALWFLAPLTALTLAVSLWRAVSAKKGG